MALSTPGSLSQTSSLNLAVVGNVLVVPMSSSKRLALTVNGLAGSGATLAVDGSRDGGVTWATIGMPAIDFDTSAVLTTLSDDSDYWVVTHGYTHVQVRVVAAGGGAASILLVSEARSQRPAAAAVAAGSSLNPAQDGTDATGVTAPAGAVGIRGWLSSIYARLAGTLAVSDPQNAAYNSWPVISPSGGTYTLPPGTRNLSANVTTAGNISMSDGSGSVKTLPLGLGFQTFPFLPATFTTTATATFWADK